MENTDLKNKTTEKLQSTLNMVKAITGVLVVVVSILTAVSIYGLIAKENTSTFIALLAVALSSLSIVLLQFTSIKKIKAELNLRQTEK